MQQKGVAGVQVDGGGGDVSVGQDADELAAGGGQVVGGAVGTHQQGGGMSAAGQGEAESALVAVGVSRPKITVQNRGSVPLYSWFKTVLRLPSTAAGSES